MGDMIEVLPREQVGLEILETVHLTPAVVARCQELKVKGWKLALDDIVEITPEMRAVLPLMQVVKVQVRGTDAYRLPMLVKELRAYPCLLLAEQVETRSQMELCEKLGFDLFQGYYFARPHTLQGKRTNFSRLSLLQLLTKVMQDAETEDLERAFKQEPGLAVNLLRMVNAAAFGVRSPIRSLRHAISMLGRGQLQRWLQLVLYTSPEQSTQSLSPLLHLAATRGRLLELLAQRLPGLPLHFPDQAFLVGMLSLTPALLEMTMVDIIEQLPHLSKDVTEALLHRSGALGNLLALCEDVEGRQSGDFINTIRQFPQLTAHDISMALAQALNWVNEINDGLLNSNASEIEVDKNR